MSISSFIFTYLKNKLPSINWNMGSTIRELIATPMVTLTEGAATALNNQANAVSLKSMANNPEQYKDEIESIFNELSLATNNATASTGVVTIMTESSQPSAVLKNTAFYIGDQSVYVAYDVYPSLNADGSAGSTPLRELGYRSYAFEVPVSTTGMNTYLSVGTSLTWDEAPDDIYDIVVTSAVSGGRTNMSLDEKLQKIQDYIAPEIVSLSDGISKTLRKALPDVVVDACYAADPATKLAVYAQNVIEEEEGINKSYLYVKPTKAPGYEYIEVTGEGSDGTYTIETKIIGIIDLVEAYIGSKGGASAKLIPLQHVQIIDNRVYCTVEYKGGSTEIFTLKVYRMASADIIQKFLDGYTAGSPYKIEVKAPQTFDLMLDFAYTGQELGTQDYLNLCSAVQSTGLNTAITDTKLSALLETFGANLKGTCAYTLITHNGCCYKQQYATSLYYSTQATSYAIYLGVTNINAKHI